MTEEEMDLAPAPSHYVGVGASAGGLEAIEQFFQGIPKESGLAFIVIQHLSPDYKSMMVELLSKKTDLLVLRAEEGMVVEKNTVYLIPPKKNLTIFHGRLLLSDQPPHDRWINLPIDIFFRSLAEDQGEKAVGVILSGTGSDGSRGVRAIKEFGGMIMVQDDKDARFDGMPRSAASTGIADFILPAAEMAEKLLSYVKFPFLTKTDSKEKLIRSDDGLTAIFAMLRAKTKVDFTYYKPSTVIRRIERRMNVNQMDDLQAYIRLLNSNARELTTLYREILIGVTTFFRDREAFDFLAESLLPEMLEKKKNTTLRAWVAGCSSGEEAYSLAILLHDLQERLKTKATIKIFATDVDNDAVMVAGSGIYPESIAADVGPALLSRYFQRQGDNYCVSRKIREMVVFAQHNLIKDPPFTNIDLVSCRNLLIYLQPVLQKKALEMFNFSLPQGGILFLGSSETTGDMSSFFAPVNHRWKIYTSKGRRSFPAGRPETALRFSGPPGQSRTLPIHAAGAGSRHGEPDRQLGDRLLKALSPDVIPLTVVINEELEVVYTIGDTGEFFRLPPGKMDNDIRKMVQKELAIPLTIGVQKAFKEEREVSYANIRFHGKSGTRIIQINIRPLPASKAQPGYMAILFQECGDRGPGGNGSDSDKKTYDYDRETEQRILDLEQELQFTKENLQATIEELETSNEELQATNEELLASNEELQSTNEELQSVNEELYTVNSEHQHKIMELTELNNDIDNLLTSTEIGTVFLDEKLQVRKFTPYAQHVFNIIDSDIGRPFSHLTHTLEQFNIMEAVQQVLATSKTSDHKVRAENGGWYFIRILPYHVAPLTFAGVVITIIDITDLVGAETALQRSEAYLGLAEKAARFASWQWDPASDRLVSATNLDIILGRSFEPASLSLAMLQQFVHPDDLEMVNEKIAGAVATARDFEVVHRLVRPDGSIRLVKQVAVAEGRRDGRANRLTGITIDLTGTEEQGDGGESGGKLLNGARGSLKEGLIVIEDSGRITSVSTSIESLFGYGVDDLVGKNISMLMPEPHRGLHDGYIRRYLETGEPHVIDKGRQVQVVCKDGTLVDAQLSIGEIKTSSRSLFTGILARI